MTVLRYIASLQILRYIPSRRIDILLLCKSNMMIARSNHHFSFMIDEWKMVIASRFYRTLLEKHPTNGGSAVNLEKEGIFRFSCYRLNLNFGNFTLQFDRLRQSNLLKCVPHVQYYCFSSFSQSDHCFRACLCRCRRGCCFKSLVVGAENSHHKDLASPVAHEILLECHETTDRHFCCMLRIQR